ncbi:hypothetical protein SDJN02_10682 [Cucurbita argyrosperma subsp. argyrosperma]|nr:hypothetical protein SDJN02_10682 [Cucurbita argyrosperma subsp. argyrosperma]
MMNIFEKSTKFRLVEIVPRNLLHCSCLFRDQSLLLVGSKEISDGLVMEDRLVRRTAAEQWTLLL